MWAPGHRACFPHACSERRTRLCLAPVGKGADHGRLWKHKAFGYPGSKCWELLGLLEQEKMRGKWFLQGGGHSLLGPRSAQAWSCLADLLPSSRRPSLCRFPLSCTLAWAGSLRRVSGFSFSPLTTGPDEQSGLPFTRHWSRDSGFLPGSLSSCPSRERHEPMQGHRPGPRGARHLASWEHRLPVKLGK